LVPNRPVTPAIHCCRPAKLFVPGERSDGLKYGGAHATLHPPKTCSQLQIAAQKAFGEP